MEEFDRIGDELERRWRALNYDAGVFPELAVNVLEQNAPAEHVDPWDVIRWLFTTPSIPRQFDVPGNFGQPPITVYDGPRFCIDVYYSTQRRRVLCGCSFGPVSSERL